MGAPLDLFGAASAEGAWTVSEVTRRARAVIEAGLPPLWVRGEVTGFKAWRSGHWYFSLRDKTAQIRCVMFRDDNRGLPAPPVDGTQVFAFARPTVYDAKGEFHLTVKELLSTEQGGLWKLAFEKARAALFKDGLLDPARKRRLPPFPCRIAVVTSPDGAALRDIHVVLARRWPVAELVLVPAKVQGEGAEASVCAALARVARLEVDVAIVGRGGGAAEDLWTFNSERVARAVAAVPVPVISAVGHETDVTLCDLVADLRAPTPSAAAEAATPDRVEVLAHVAHLGQRLARGLTQRAQRTVDRLDRSGDRLTGAMQVRLGQSRSLLTAYGARLDALSPLKILARGYAVARDADGRVLKRVVQLPLGQTFLLRVTDGEVGARVSSPPDPLSVPERGNEGKWKGGCMNAVLRRRLEMAARVRDFLRAHKTDAVGEGLGLAKLEELIQRAEALDAQQRAGLVEERKSTRQREGLRQALQRKLLLYLRALGALGNAEKGELAVQLVVPPANSSQRALLTAGREMWEKATAQKDVLLSRGMPPTLLDDLAGALSEFEKTMEATRAGRRDHVGASADLQAVAAEIKKQVRALDGMVRYRFGDNAELMGAWASARNVLGPFKSRTSPESGGGEAPGSPGVVKPAA